MTYVLATINPFYAARTQPVKSARATRFAASKKEERLTLSLKVRQPALYARLPQAPVTASPVPHLTSLYHFHRAGEYGDRGYPGNCGGNLIKDLLRYFKPGLVLDPMRGSGTCEDVCQELGIPCLSSDIHQGSDACDPRDFTAVETFDFIWAHPLCGA